MLMPDVNVLVYAHRGDEKTHAFYQAWMEEAVNAREPFALSVLAAVGFVRIVTNRRIYPDPTPLPVALAVIDSLRTRRNCRLLGPGPRHWELLRGLCSATGAAGKLVADAQHASVAMEHGCTWVTRDADFRAFEDHGLRWRQLSPPQA